MKATEYCYSKVAESPYLVEKKYFQFMVLVINLHSLHTSIHWVIYFPLLNGSDWSDTVKPWSKHFLTVREISLNLQT